MCGVQREVRGVHPEYKWEYIEYEFDNKRSHFENKRSTSPDNSPARQQPDNPDNRPPRQCPDVPRQPDNKPDVPRQPDGQGSIGDYAVGSESLDIGNGCMCFFGGDRSVVCILYAVTTGRVAVPPESNPLLLSRGPLGP